MKCPKCRKGKIFKGAMYSFKEYGNMHETCPNCQLKYEKETGFFYGAMYVSYGLTIAFSVAVYVLFAILGYFLNFDLGIWGNVTLIILTLVLLTPFTFRLSRTVWIHLFNKFEDQK